MSMNIATDYSHMPSEDLLPDDIFPREIKIWLRENLLSLRKARGRARFELDVSDGRIRTYHKRDTNKVLGQ